MPYFDASDFTVEQLKAFNAKFNVMIDTDEMYEMLGKLKNGAEKISNTMKDRYSTDIQKFETKTKIQNALINEYKESYGFLLTDVMNQHLQNAGNNEKNTNIGEMFNDFENMMNRILYKETSMARTIPLTSVAFGGMNQEEIYGITERLELKTMKAEIMDSFRGKSTYDIDKEVRESYLKNPQLDYDKYISMAQAVKQKNVSRGFWGRFFHPIDSSREKNLVNDLCEKAKQLFRTKDVENDLNTKKIFTADSRKEKNSLDDVFGKFEEMTLDPHIYNQDKMSELSKEFPTKFLSPEDAKKKAEDKYKNEIYPKFDEVYRNGGDLTDLREEFKIDFEGYKNRFLAEKEEQQKEENYKNNIYPKFKEAYEKNNGDLSSLKEEFKEDFQVMQVKFLKDLKDERSNDMQGTEKIEEDFQEALKGNLEENLSIDTEIKINDVVNSGNPVVENNDEQIL